MSTCKLGGTPAKEGGLSGFCEPRKLGYVAAALTALYPHHLRSFTMKNDPRCCGTGTCIINEEGLCWCGQQWNGERMCFPDRPAEPAPENAEGRADSADSAEGSGD